jgi:HEAT repeat protein
MTSFVDRFRQPLKSRVKRALAGDDVDALVTRRDRRRLRWLAQSGAEPLVRFRALRALAELADRDAADVFVTTLELTPGDAEAASVRVAAEGLGRMRHAAAAPALRRLLNPERPAQVQLAAARALATLGDGDDWSAIRRWAPSQLLIPDDRDLSDPLDGALPPGTATVALVLQTLFADKSGTWWASKARTWLEGDEERPRIPAMEGADRIVAQQLRTSLERKELDAAELRATLLRLGTLSLDRDQGLLTAGLADAGRGRDWLQALGHQGDPRSVDVLCDRVAAATSPEEARDALRALGRLGWRGSEDTIGAARDRWADEGVRIEATWALGELGGEAAVRSLMEDLRKRADRDDPSEAEYPWIAAALRRAGLRGREAIRGARTIAISAGERRRLSRVADLAGIP